MPFRITSNCCKKVRSASHAASGRSNCAVSCEAEDQVVEGRLRTSKVPVAQRAAHMSTSLHYYTGYPGTLSWEYNVGGCEDKSRNQKAHLCGCVNANNYQRTAYFFNMFSSSTLLLCF